jgi:hypothetical protein
MDGPAFSTRAESNAHRQLGFDVIGMTNLPEAKLAREAEIALATLAMITDYDCWKVEEEAVTAESVIGIFMRTSPPPRPSSPASFPKSPDARLAGAPLPRRRHCWRCSPRWRFLATSASRRWPRR